MSPLTDAYRKSCDFAFQKVSTGAQDYNSAVREATRNLVQKGIQVIDYESGVRTSLEAAVRRNIMGGLGLMQEQISQQTHDVLGCNGWEISAHAGSAPDHEPIQGKQYSDEAFEKLNNSLVRRIGTLNCGHAAFPIILGVNSPQYTKAELEKMRRDNETGITYNGRHYTMYEATQRQRQLERDIRTQKRKILVDEKAEDKEKLQTDQIRYQVLNGEYKRFSDAAGLRMQHERMEMTGFGPKQAKAAEKAGKGFEESLEKQRQYDTMIAEIKSAGNIPKNAIVNIPVKKVDTTNLSFDNAHINAERKHNVTRQQAETWVEEARMSATVWTGKFERFYSSSGATYVNMEDKIIRTAFSAEDFDENTKAIMEVLTRYGY